MDYKIATVGLKAAGICAATGELTTAGAIAFGRLLTLEHPVLVVEVHDHKAGLAEVREGVQTPPQVTRHVAPARELISDQAGELALKLAPRAHDRGHADHLARELVVNALGHRSFAPPHLHRPVRIDVYTDQVHIASPGGLPPSVRERRGLIEGRRSINPTLMGFLVDLGLARQEGTGLPWAASLATDLGFRLHHEAADDQVTAILEVDPTRRVRASRRDDPSERRRRLAPSLVDQRVLDALFTDRPTTSKELVATLGVSAATLRVALERLVNQGLVERQCSSHRSPHQAYLRKR